jgi:hypothetical protein
MTNRISVAYRVTERTVKWIVALSELLGLSKTGIVERAVQELAQRQKL